MENRDTILQELQHISPAVAYLSNQNLFYVPPDYFHNLADEILFKINISLIPGATNPYQAPGGYFDDLSNIILQKIQIQQQKNKHHAEVVAELQLTAPLLNTISKENLYTVPEDYFTNFNIKIPVSNPRAKVISLTSKAKRWMAYSVAACVAAILLTGGYLLLNRQGDYGQKEFAGKLEQVNRLNIDQGISALSDDEINNYLNSQNNSFSDIFLNTMEEYPDVDQLLDNTTDEEIRQYLDDNKEPRQGKKNIKEI